MLSSKTEKKRFNLLSSNNSVFDFQTVNNIYNNNLKKICIKFPINKITSITGVSGSGKSSLLSEIFSYYNETIDKKVFYKVRFIDRVLNKTSKLSTAGTYSGIFEYIRFVFAQTSLAKKRGLVKVDFHIIIKIANVQIVKVGDLLNWKCFFYLILKQHVQVVMVADMLRNY